MDAHGRGWSGTPYVAKAGSDLLRHFSSVWIASKFRCVPWVPEGLRRRLPHLMVPGPWSLIVEMCESIFQTFPPLVDSQFRPIYILFFYLSTPSPPNIWQIPCILSSVLDEAGVCRLTPDQLAVGFLQKLLLEMITIAAPTKRWHGTSTVWSWSPPQHHHLDSLVVEPIPPMSTRGGATWLLRTNRTVRQNWHVWPRCLALPSGAWLEQKARWL